MKARALGWSLTLFLCALPLRADALLQVPVLLHVATLNGQPVADDAFITDQLEHANTIYRPLGYELVIVARRKLGQAHARLIERSDRDDLQASLQAGVVNWFIVATLMDVDEPGRERRGVHWRVRAQPSKHFVVVSAISGSYVLAHELGHFFGNPQHSDVVGNLMSYQHTEAVPVLDDAQQERVRQTIEAMFARAELVPVERAERSFRAKRAK